MERTHCQLCTRFTDGLSSDNTESIADFRITVCRQVLTIAFYANTMFNIASQNRTDQNAIDTASFDTICNFRCEFLTGSNDQATVIISRVTDILCAEATEQTIFQRQQFFVTFDNRTYPDTFHRTAVFTTANDVLRNVNKFTGHVTGVSGLQRRVSQTFTGTVCRNEVFLHGQTFTEVGEDRTFDNITGRFCHQTTHTCKLTDLVFTASSSRVEHGVQRVDLFLTGCFGFSKQIFRNTVGGLCPNVNHLIITFTVSQ